MTPTKWKKQNHRPHLVPALTTVKGIIWGCGSYTCKCFSHYYFIFYFIFTFIIFVGLFDYADDKGMPGILLNSENYTELRKRSITEM